VALAIVLRFIRTSELLSRKLRDTGAQGHRELCRGRQLTCSCSEKVRSASVSWYCALKRIASKAGSGAKVGSLAGAAAGSVAVAAVTSSCASFLEAVMLWSGSVATSSSSWPRSAAIWSVVGRLRCAFAACNTAVVNAFVHQYDQT
jgi:hypothetical protein